MGRWVGRREKSPHSVQQSGLCLEHAALHHQGVLCSLHLLFDSRNSATLCLADGTSGKVS